MLIDPFIVIAQIINFLILVVLLKRFLYKPITQAMAGRVQRIERQLAAAALKEKDAEAEKESYLNKQQKLEAQKQSWLKQAKQEVEEDKEKLMQQAQAEVNLMRSQWYDNLERDKQKFIRQLRDRLSRQVAMATRKTLLELANADLERQIIATFIARMSELDAAQLKTIRNTLFSNSDRVVTINSSFTISSELRECLTAAVREKITADAELQFEKVADLICGIELRYGGYKIAWNLNRYLTELEVETAKVLAEKNNQAA